jgi:hypothetical protein
MQAWRQRVFSSEFTARQPEARTLRALTDLGLAHMELIVTSFLAATLLLVGHFGVLVRNRLFGTR